MRHTLRPIHVFASLAACAGLLLLAAGCASSGYDKGNKTAAGLQKTADRIAALPGQIDKTLASLNDIVEKPQTDLRPQFKQFSANLAEVESTAKDIADARKAMGEKGKEFFAQWDQELAQIKSEDIKARSQSRKDEVAQKMNAIKASYAETEIAFKPFMADLKDVQKFLSVDLTTGGVTAIKDTVARAVTSSVPLKTSIAKLAGDFKALGVAMSSVTPPAEPAK